MHGPLETGDDGWSHAEGNTLPWAGQARGPGAATDTVVGQEAQPADAWVRRTRLQA